MRKHLPIYIATTIFATMLIALSTNTANAQLSNLSLQAEGLAQNNLLNPALMPASSFVSMPFIGSFEIGAKTPLTYQNLFTKINGANFINNQGIINALNGNNNVTSVNFNMDILNGGFFIGKNNYIGINLSTKIHMATNLPGDVFSMLTDNPIDMQTATYDIDFNPNMMGWAEFGLSYSRKLPLGITVGGRVKFLSGLMSLQSESSFRIQKSYDQYILDGDFNVKAGNINLANVDAQKSLNGLADNMGFGADIGVAWEGLDGRLKASAAVTDMGFINWSDQSSTIHGSGTGFEFNGLGDLKNLLDGGNISSLMDSVSTAFTETIGADTTTGKLRTNLPTRYQARAEYKLGRKNQHGVSAAFQGAQMFHGQFDYVLSVGYTYRSPSTRWQFMANYSYRPNVPYAMGVAMAYTSRGVQIYLGIDNIIPIFDIRKANQTNIKLALNFMIQSKKNTNKIF